MKAAGTYGGGEDTHHQGGRVALMGVEVGIGRHVLRRGEEVGAVISCSSRGGMPRGVARATDCCDSSSCSGPTCCQSSGLARSLSWVLPALLRAYSHSLPGGSSYSHSLPGGSCISGHSISIGSGSSGGCGCSPLSISPLWIKIEDSSRPSCCGSSSERYRSSVDGFLPSRAWSSRC